MRKYFLNCLSGNTFLKIGYQVNTKGNTKKETRKFNPSFLMTRKILGIVFISGGSSWATDDDNTALEIIASRAAKNTKRSWKHLFKFPKEYICPVHLYDITKAYKGGWNCERVGEIMPYLKSGKLGKKPCKFIKTINVVL